MSFMIGFAIILVFCRITRAHPACAIRRFGRSEAEVKDCCSANNSYAECCIYRPGAGGLFPKICADFCDGTLPNGGTSFGASDLTCQAQRNCVLSPTFDDCCYTFDSDLCKSFCDGSGAALQECGCVGFGSYDYTHCCESPFSTSHPVCVKHCLSTYSRDPRCPHAACVESPSFESCCVYWNGYNPTDCTNFCASSSDSRCACKTNDDFPTCCPLGDIGVPTCGGNSEYGSAGGYCSNDDFPGGGGSGGLPSAGTVLQDDNCRDIICVLGIDSGSFLGGSSSYSTCCGEASGPASPAGALCRSYCAAGGYDPTGACVTVFCTSGPCLDICPIRKNPYPDPEPYLSRPSCETCTVRQTYAQCCQNPLSSDCTNFPTAQPIQYNCATAGSFSSCCGGPNGLDDPSCGGALRFTPTVYYPSYAAETYEYSIGGYCSKGGAGGWTSGSFSDPLCAVLVCATTNTDLYDGLSASCCADPTSASCSSFKGILTGCSTHLLENACNADGACGWSADTGCTAKSAESTPEKPFPWFIIVIVVVVVVLILVVVVVLIVLKKNKKVCFKEGEDRGESGGGNKQKEQATVENANSGAKGHIEAPSNAGGSGDAPADLEADTKALTDDVPETPAAEAPTDADTGIKDKPADVHTDASAVARPKAKLKPNPKTKSKAGPKAESKTKPKAKSNANSKAKSKAAVKK